MDFNIEETLASMGVAIGKSFWTDGEIPDKIGYIVSNTTAHMRYKLMLQHLPVDHDRGAIKAMLLYYQLTKSKFNARVAALKYKILCEAAKSVESGWTVQLDKDCEDAAWRIVRLTKTKNPPM